jgi:hypothetical protein
MKTNIVSLVLVPLLILGWFELLPSAQAVSPAPDGGYPGFTTAEGTNALQNLSAGIGNTAAGWYSLFTNSSGSYNTGVGAGTLIFNTANSNTAIGAVALFSNTTGNQNTAIGGQALSFNNTGTGNIAIGYQAGSSLTTGSNNIEIGNIGVASDSSTIRIGDPSIHTEIFVAGITAMSPATPNQMVLVDPASGQLGSADIPSSGVVSTDPENTAVGDQALISNTGGYNTATGFQALFSNTSADSNTAMGDQALLSNTGPNNTAVGAGALSSNAGSPNPNDDSGAFNNAVGANSLFFNVDGSSNNALGESALLSNIHASANTAIGDVALENNDSSGTGDGGFNTAVGAGALFANVDGNSNNAFGFLSLGSNTIGVYNNAIGFQALGNNVSGSSNVAIGDSAGLSVTTASNVICIGAGVDGANVSNSCYIGSIFGETSSGGAAVLINSSGKLGTVTSSRKFKEQIKAMGTASEVLFALTPVTFRYKRDIDETGVQQFGLVAEDVEKVNPDLVVRDKHGNPFSVRYEQVNAMLLNEFLKEHDTVQELKATIARQAKQIEALAASLEKVNARIEVSQSAQRTVLNNE